MLEFFKKLLSSKPKVTSLNEDLCYLIDEILATKDLNDKLLNNINKYIFVNVRYSDFNMLLDNLLNKKNAPIITSVSLEYYFRYLRGHFDIETFLKRIREILVTNEVSDSVKSDLTELINAFNFALRDFHGYQ